MLDPDDSWDMERRIDRDHHREPVRRATVRPALNPHGTTRARFEPDAPPPSYTNWLDILRQAGLLIFLGLLASCTDDEPLPTCSDLGCPVAPSGTPDIWSPCDEPICFCGTAACRKGLL